MERVAMSIDTSHDFGSPFGDWPLRSYEEEQMRLRDQLDKHRDHILLYGGLTLWGLLGAAFIISSTYISHEIVSEITRDIRNSAFLGSSIGSNRTYLDRINCGSRRISCRYRACIAARIARRSSLDQLIQMYQ
jgi:hypothetical protein